MLSRTANSLAPILAASLLSWFIAGCSGCNPPEEKPAAAPQQQEAAPTEPPKVPLVEEVEEPAATPTAAPDAQATAAAGQRSACDHKIAVLSGREKDDSLQQSADFQAFASQSADLVICQAVATDSDDLCKRSFAGATSGFVPEGPYRQCLDTWSTLLEPERLAGFGDG